MTKIKKFIEKLDDEICDAKAYAECYIEEKAKGSSNASKYKDMATDELKHAGYIHDIVVQFIEELRKVFTPTEAMQDEWDRSHREYVEKVAWIKQMLSL